MNTRHVILTIAFFLAFVPTRAQLANLSMFQSPSGVTFQWNGYHGAYTQMKEIPPFLIVHRFTNDKYAPPGDLSPSNPAYIALENKYRSMPGLSYISLPTTDSSVEVVVPQLYKTNASLYEYRIIFRPGGDSSWKAIDSFTDEDQGFDFLKKGIGRLGTFTTPGWDQYLVAELRKKGSDSLSSVISVYWKPVHPTILNIYTTNQLNDFLANFRQPGRLELTKEDRAKWKAQYAEKELDSLSGLPKRLVLKAPVNGIIFCLNGAVYKKEGIEYQVICDSKILQDWKTNDFDNNLIWLNNPSPGTYTLRFRYSGQRQNVSEYPFQIKPAWHQTALFKIIFGGLIASFFCFIIVSLLLRRQKKKMAGEELEKQRLTYELKAVYAQLNPHFVFNALSSIQGLIGKKEFSEANVYLARFSDLLRATLTGTEKEFVTIDREIEILKTYLSLEKLRFGFQYGVEADKEINVSETEIPFLLLQPLVENAVKHGVAAKAELGRVDVRFEKQGSGLLVKISDNGTGFREKDTGSREKETAFRDKATEFRGKATEFGGKAIEFREIQGKFSRGETTGGFGLRLTRNRIEILNKLPGGRTITLSTLSDSEHGTTVTVHFNNWFL